MVRLGGSASGVTVEVATVDGTALAGTHYTAVAGTLTFGAGQTTTSFTVPLLDNGLDEAGRWLGLVLTVPGGGGTLGTPRSASLEWDGGGRYHPWPAPMVRLPYGTQHI